MTTMYDKVNTQMEAMEIADAVAVPVVEQTVEVVAPADLQPGYQFTVELDGDSMIVAVVS